MKAENRKRSRVATGVEAVVECTESGRQRVQVRNLSLKGMLCDPEARLKPSGACHVVIELSGGVVVRIEANIVRNDGRGLALDFEGMDEDAFFHLRNIVRYHAQDADAIDQELAVPAFESRSGK